MSANENECVYASSTRVGFAREFSVLTARLKTVGFNLRDFIGSILELIDAGVCSIHVDLSKIVAKCKLRMNLILISMANLI